LPLEPETEGKGQISETTVKLNEIIDALARQTDIIRENRERWLRSVLEIQKDMAYQIDIFHGLEDELSLQKKLIQDIVEVNPPRSVHIPEAIEELRGLTFRTLELIEKMQLTEDSKLIPEIMSSNYGFKMNLFNYIGYLETEFRNWAGKGLQKFRLVLEDRDNLEQQSPYVLKAGN
jgi:hypothetical protein